MGTKTVALEDDVHKQLKHESVEQEVPIRQLVDEYLREAVLNGEGQYPHVERDNDD